MQISWNNTRRYIKEALDLINIDLNNHVVSLDNEEKQFILDKLGEPPLCNYNIYFITIHNTPKERIVYIGKTNSQNSRFANGHLAALKLHNTIYEGYKKEYILAL